MSTLNSGMIRRRSRTVASAALIVVVATMPSFAQDGDPSADSEGQGWTGLTRPEDVIAARQMLMFTIEDLMVPIDTYTVDDSIDPGEISEHASSIAAMLQATPHLFPPTTNLYDEADDYPATLALPSIWSDFDAFYSLAETATYAALDLVEADSPDELRVGAVGLRATCDACHGVFLRPYERGGVTDEDRNFDFDSLFEN